MTQQLKYKTFNKRSLKISFCVEIIVPKVKKYEDDQIFFKDKSKIISEIF